MIEAKTSAAPLPVRSNAGLGLVERLRELDEKGYQPLTGAIGHEAADEIIKLRSFLNCLVTRRTDGTVVICQDDFAWHAATSYYAMPNVKVRDCGYESEK